MKWLTPLFILLLAAIVIAADRGTLPGAIGALVWGHGLWSGIGRRRVARLPLGGGVALLFVAFLFALDASGLWRFRSSLGDTVLAANVPLPSLPGLLPRRCSPAPCSAPWAQQRVEVRSVAAPSDGEAIAAPTPAPGSAGGLSGNPKPVPLGEEGSDSRC